ncbi:MAG: glycosyltransferase family 2 protein [Proteobacteria bacterium]|nr:glycosyltransferase family 2 protein [Pseudomonadota bacterium]
MNPILCVGFTYFNEQAMLTQAIVSLACQGTSDLEILVYDDASSYSAQNYLPENIPVRVIRGEHNLGPSCGRNILLRESRAQYIHFHDSDDLFLPEWQAEVRRVLDQHQPDAVFTELISTQDGVAHSSRVMGLSELAEHGDLTRFCIEGVMLTIAGTYRRAFVLDLGGYDESVHQSEDYDFHIRLSLAAPQYELLTRPLAELRLRPDSRSTRRIEVYRDSVRVLERLAKSLTPSYRSYIGDALLRFSRNLYQLGDIDGARAGFALAVRLGPPSYSSQPNHYRWAARLLGFARAERLAAAYRKLTAHYTK